MEKGPNCPPRGRMCRIRGAPETTYYLQTPGFVPLTSPNRKHTAVEGNEPKGPSDICPIYPGS